MPAAMDTACSSVSARMTFGWTRSASASSPAEAPIRITASVFASTSRTHSRRSKSLPYPPAIRITGAPGNALNATRPASGLVAYELQPVLDTLEAADRLVDRVIAESRDASNCGRCEGVVHVVPSRQRHRRERLVLVEPDNLAGRAAGERAYHQIATVQHCVVGVLDRPRLDVDISFEGAVAV